MRFIIALVLAINVAGCSAAAQRLEAITGATITQDQVDTARNGYDAAVLAPMRRYALLPKCKAGQTFLVNNCHDAAWLKQMRNIDQTVARDFDSVQALMKDGNAPALQTAWAILTDAISTAKTQVAQQGVK